MLTYWLLAALWFVLTMIRCAYLAGRRELDGDGDLFWYMLAWGAFGGCLWPLALPYVCGFKVGRG